MFFGISRGTFHQYVAALTACFSAVTSGSAYGWITPLLSRLLSSTSEIPMTQAESNWVAAIIEFGGLIGPSCGGYLSNRFGRKPTILVSGPLFIVSWLFLLQWPTVLCLGIVRFSHGFIMSLPFTAGPCYLGEIASPNSRGSITSLLFNAWWLGFIISYAVGPFLDVTDFIWFTLLLNVPFILMFFWQPESPYYCVMTGNLEKAEKSLRWFRDSSTEKLKEEIQEIKRSVENDMKASKIESSGLRDMVATPGDRNALLLLLVISTVRISSGTGTLLVYATQVFDQTPNLVISSDFVTDSFGVVMFIGGCVSSITSDFFGRRTLLLISSSVCCFCTTLTGIYYYMLTNTSYTSTFAQFSWIAPVLILVYAGFCSAGLYPVCVAYISELFSNKTRNLASTISFTTTIVFAFISMIIFQPINNWLGLYANFCIYSTTTFLGCIYFYFCAPETKNKTLLQIRNELCGVVDPNSNDLSTEL